MNGDSKLAKPDMSVAHRNGTVVTLAVHKGSTDQPGWWLTDDSVGLANTALNSDNWVLLTPERVARLFEVPDEVDPGPVVIVRCQVCGRTAEVPSEVENRWYETHVCLSIPDEVEEVQP